METPEASDLKAYPTCKICDRGTLMPKEMRRLSGPAVAIGYILLIPSILGMAACAILLVVSLLAGVASAAHGSPFATAFAGIGTLVFVYIGICCFVFGLLGWLLIMKKHVLQCVYCGAVVDAAPAVHSHPNRSYRRASVFGFFFLLLIFIAMAASVFHDDYKVWAEGGRSYFDWTEFAARLHIHTATGPAQQTPDNSTAEPIQPAQEDSAAPAVSYDVSTSRELAVPGFERCLMRTAMANHLTFASPEAVRQLIDACPNTSHGYVDACMGDAGQTEMGCDMATGLVAASVLNHLNPAKTTATTVQPAPQAEPESAPTNEPALPFQPSPESTDVTPAPVGSQQETSRSPSTPQTTEVTQGQTPDQVVAILGPPVSITTGPTPVYNYPHLVIVFARGKVWKIHEFQ
jgi:hypothetical protein